MSAERQMNLSVNLGISFISIGKMALLYDCVSKVFSKFRCVGNPCWIIICANTNFKIPTNTYNNLFNLIPFYCISPDNNKNNVFDYYYDCCNSLKLAPAPVGNHVWTVNGNNEIYFYTTILNTEHRTHSKILQWIQQLVFSIPHAKDPLCEQ